MMAESPTDRMKPPCGMPPCPSAFVSGSPEKSLEQPAMRVMAVVEKLRMPLNSQQERMAGRLDGLNHAIGRHRAGDQRRGDLLDRLVVRAVDANDGLSNDLSQ